MKARKLSHILETLQTHLNNLQSGKKSSSKPPLVDEQLTICQKLMDELEKTMREEGPTPFNQKTTIFKPRNGIEKALMTAYKESYALMLKHGDDNSVVQTTKIVTGPQCGATVNLISNMSIEQFIAEGNGTALHRDLTNFKNAVQSYQLINDTEFFKNEDHNKANPESIEMECFSEMTYR